MDELCALLSMVMIYSFLFSAFGLTLNAKPGTVNEIEPFGSCNIIASVVCNWLIGMVKSTCVAKMLSKVSSTSFHETHRVGIEMHFEALQL